MSRLALVDNLAAVGEVVAAVMPKLPGAGPSSASEVTPQWLTSHVGATVPGAVALRVSSLDGTTGTTDRRRLAVEWNEAGRAAGLPPNLFVKSTPLTAKNRTMVAALGMAVNEARFYNQAAKELAGVVPHAWFAQAGIGARFLIVLDDIVAAGARPYALADECDIAHARGSRRRLRRTACPLLGEPAVAAGSVLGPNMEHPNGIRRAEAVLRSWSRRRVAA
jgi:hypothetical protein